ncbi:MAG: DUF4093 domain-containing protein, partial [Oscillospiraceae bacterium]|nr:DUF4093 domain-containing protein [Oscillospiraceae bacterium]
EGTLGVEGVSRQIIEDALKRAGVLGNGNATSTGQTPITKLNLYEDGLIGGENSAVLRRKLLERLSFPKYISSNNLVTTLNNIMDYNEYKKLISEIKQQGE